MIAAILWLAFIFGVAAAIAGLDELIDRRFQRRQRDIRRAELRERTWANLHGSRRVW